MNKHTQTPYYVEPDMGGTYNITVGPPTGLIVAKVNPYNDVPDEMAMHNAMRLAKAANCHADLLAALEMAAELVKTARQYFPRSIKDAATFKLEATNAAITAAIAKAQPTNAD